MALGFILFRDYVMRALWVWIKSLYMGVLNLFLNVQNLIALTVLNWFKNKTKKNPEIDCTIYYLDGLNFS